MLLYLSPPAYPMTQHTCTNCGNVFTGHFCNECGQKLTHRYTVGHVLHEFVHVFTHADKGIFAFSKQILFRPGVVALDFVEGRRKRHFNLFQFLLLVLSAATFLMVKTNMLQQTMQSVNHASHLQYSSELLRFQQKIGSFIQQYTNVLQFIMLPLIAFFSWLFLRKARFNYAEHVVLHAAVLANTNLLSIVAMLCILVFPSLMQVQLFASFILTMAVYGLAYNGFLKKAWWKGVLLGFACYIGAYIVIMLLSVITMIIYIVSVGGPKNV